MYKHTNTQKDRHIKENCSCTQQRTSYIVTCQNCMTGLVMNIPNHLAYGCVLQCYCGCRIAAQRPLTIGTRQGDTTLHYTTVTPHCSLPSHSTVAINNTTASCTLQCSGWLAVTQPTSLVSCLKTHQHTPRPEGSCQVKPKQDNVLWTTHRSQLL